MNAIKTIGGANPGEDREELEHQLRFLREYRDWAVRALAVMPGPQPGSGVNLTTISERLQNAANAASHAIEWLTEQLAALPAPRPLSPGERPHHLRYVNMSIIEAVVLFLNQEQCPKTEEELIKEIEDGGAIIGRIRQQGEIKKSLDANVRAGTLKLVGGKYGPADWPEEKFGK